MMKEFNSNNNKTIKLIIIILLRIKIISRVDILN